MNNTIIIVSKDSALCRISLSESEGKITAKKCRPEAITNSSKNRAANRINALNEVVNCLKQIDKKTELATPIKILTIDMVLTPIQNGTPLFWFANQNKTSSGDELDPKEMELWLQFYELYGRNIMKVIFGSVASAASFAKNSKYPITKDMRTIAEYIKAAWEDVDERIAATIEDIETDEI